MLTAATDAQFDSKGEEACTALRDTGSQRPVSQYCFNYLKQYCGYILASTRFWGRHGLRFRLFWGGRCLKGAFANTFRNGKPRSVRNLVEELYTLEGPLLYAHM